MVLVLRVALFLLRDAPLTLFANGPTAMAVCPMRKRRSLILKTLTSRLLPTILTLMKTNSMRMTKRRRMRKKKRMSMVPWTVWPRPKAVSSTPYEN